MIRLNDFHEDLLAKHGFVVRDVGEDNPKTIEYHKTELVGDLTVNSYIEVFYNPNPDNLAYRGIVTLLREDGKRLGEWDSERRFKLMDVVLGCKRVSDLVFVIHRHLEGK